MKKTLQERLEEAEKGTLQHDINEFNNAWVAFWEPVKDWVSKLINAI